MKSKKFHISLYSFSTFFFAPSIVRAVDSEGMQALETISTTSPDDSLVTIDRPEAAVRVRIPVEITPYHKTAVRSKKGDLTMASIPEKPVTYALRARIDRPNHFYFGEWHMEAIPQLWNKTDHRYKTKIRVSRRFGQVLTDVEEYVGVIEASGSLAVTADANVMEFFSVGPATTFRDKEGFSLVDIKTGKSISETVFSQRSGPPTASKATNSVP